jgi:hypothetical protein
MLATGRTRALDAIHRDFDAACGWIVDHAQQPGPVLSRHPGEVFWQTGRRGLEVSGEERPNAHDADLDAIERTIKAHHVAYLLIDRDRYALAPESPLARYVSEHPDRVAKVWGRERESAVVYEVRRDR